MPSGWYRFPTVHEDTVVFVAEDDLWSAPVQGGVARRLTTGLGAAARPRLSPDGELIAFDGTEEGVREVYTVAREGGPVRRLSWHGESVSVLGWSPSGEILFSSALRQPFVRDTLAWAVRPEGGQPEALPYGPVAGLAFGPGEQLVLCRFKADLAWWKGYRGGQLGVLWHRPAPGQPFVKLALDLPSQPNVGSPVWVGDRLWFVADPDGVAQLMSGRIADGRLGDLRTHTSHREHPARFPAHHGRWVVYASGGDLWRLPASGEGAPERIDIDLRGQRAERQRRFSSPTTHLESYDLHPDGHSLALTLRGQVFVMGNWEGPALRVGESGPRRYRLARWLDAERLVVAHDGDEEALEVVAVDGGEPKRFEGLDHGWVVEIEASPDGRLVAFTDHRHGLYVLDTRTGALQRLDRSHSGPIEGFDWSSQGSWLAWALPEGVRGSRSKIRMASVAAPAEEGQPLQIGSVVDVTSGEYNDVSPSFDPDGNHLYFLSYRVFDPVSDNVYFGYSFPRAVRPYLVTLHAETKNPFQPDPRPLKGPASKTEKDERPYDLEGIGDRIVPFPVSEGLYEKIVGIGSAQVLLTRAPLRGMLSRSWYEPGPPKADLQLLVWEFDKQELVELNSKVSSIRLDRRRETLAVRSGPRLRVTTARADKGQREELRKTEGRADRKGGFVDLARVRLSVEPGAEWEQMLREAWRRMRDHFWHPGLQGVDWDAIYERYAPLVQRASTRGELSDILWCMQGELGTSHAYEMGGDYQNPPTYRLGRLGADFRWDEAAGLWRIERIVKGEPGDAERSSPLVGPGLQLRDGDGLIEVAGAPLSRELHPEAALVQQAGALVALRVVRGEERRQVVVRTLTDDRNLRYRDWVLHNRRLTHQHSDGRIGYVHIPDMGPPGFAEFHRDFARECERDALLVDVRYNRGGHVSQLLLGLLVRKRLGYTISRWNDPMPYPAYSVPGPMLALTNELAGSDGDIFSHAWKMLELGPLVGTRTWGGVVGIWPREMLIDRAMTTQPEYATWFHDAGFGLENHGAEPDVVVERTPDDWAQGADPQLERGLEMLLERLSQQPVHTPPGAAG
jgi:tricorn protease